MLLFACSLAKLESRFEANPQCKDAINPKTGALMPCPGSDRSFYVAAGLEQPKKQKENLVTEVPAQSSAPASNSQIAVSPNSSQTSSAVPPSSAVQPDCKPKIHQKTGGMLPCPPVD